MIVHILIQLNYFTVINSDIHRMLLTSEKCKCFVKNGDLSLPPYFFIVLRQIKNTALPKNAAKSNIFSSLIRKLSFPLYI
jgi:hypothetical protein